jgi:DNA-directed RNA polymerase subunit RPC12/RpoP
MDTCDKCDGRIESTGMGRAIGNQPVLMSGKCADCGARFRQGSQGWDRDPAFESDDEDGPTDSN